MGQLPVGAWLDGEYATEKDTMTMARNWKDVRAQVLATGKVDEQRIAELGTKLRAEVRAHRLAEIRQGYGMDQSTLAKRLGVSQSRISRLERGELDRPEISTVRSYVEALGGAKPALADRTTPGQGGTGGATVS